MESVVTASTYSAGFTIIELMIVVVLVAIFLVVGVPGFQNLVSDNRLAAQANRLVTSMQLARSEALKTLSPVVVCRSTNQTNCSNNGAQTWETGWIVFIDDDRDGVVEATDGNGQADAGERILKREGRLSGGNTLRVPAPINNGISYQPTGLQNTAGGNFRLCDGNNPDVNRGRQINISATGRVRTDKGSDIGGLASCP